MVRIDLERLGELRDGAVEIALPPEGRAPIVVSQVESRVERQSAIVIDNGPVEIALLVIGVAAVGQEIGLRLDADGFVVIGDGAIVLAVFGV